MTRGRFFKYILAGLAVFVVFYFSTTNVGTMSYRQLKKSLGILHTDQEPLLFMTRSITPGMSRSEVAKTVRGHSRRETLAPDHFAPGGNDVYIYNSLTFGRWKWFGEHGRIWVSYEADGRVRNAHTNLED